jgi:hypothetical protein
MRRITIAPRIGATSTEMLNSRNHAWGFAGRTWKNLEHSEEVFEQHRKAHPLLVDQDLALTRVETPRG